MEEMLISMLQKMTGLNPEQMQGMAEKAMNLLNNFASDMEAVKEAIARIEMVLAEQNGKVIDHVGINSNGSDAPGNAIVPGDFTVRN